MQIRIGECDLPCREGMGMLLEGGKRRTYYHNVLAGVVHRDRHRESASVRW